MAHFAVITPALPSHVSVHLCLAQTLMERGHRVSLLGPDGLMKVAEGLPQHPPLPRILEIGRPQVRKGKGFLQLLRRLAAETALHCEATPDILRQIGVDAVICDQMEPGGSLAAEVAGLPRITLASALPANREPGLPPPFVGWRYAEGPRAEKHFAAAWRVSDWLMSAQSRVLLEACARHGLPPRGWLSDWVSPLCDLAQGVPSLDFPRMAPGPGFHWIGSVRGPDTDSFPIDSGGRPLVFASLGTLQGGRVRLMRNIAQACADLDLCLALAHCGGLTQAQVARLPGRPVVRDFFPQRAVLAQAAAVVTHGGFNTVLDAAEHGVPMVVVPLAYEQPAIAARLERAGAARVVPRWRASRAALRDALSAVLHEPSYRAALVRPAAEIRAAGGVDRAADLIEAAVPSRPAVLAAGAG